MNTARSRGSRVNELPPAIVRLAQGSLMAGHGGEQVVQVEGLRAAGVPQRFGPRLARTVGGQLDAVAVGIGEVDSLVLAVVGGALYQGLRRR